MKKIISGSVFIGGLSVLMWSVVQSGYLYRFDADEIFNANSIYLMVKGYKPYVDFYTVYSPILHWFLTPVFLLHGFNFEAISVARGVMIGVFVIRLILTYLLVKKIFGKITGLIFILLFLLDPFTVFAAMQIRPENLMLVFFTLGLLTFTYALEKKSNLLYILTGLIMGLTLLTNVKIIPVFAAFIIFFVGHFIVRKDRGPLFFFIDGFIIVFLIFFAYFFRQGYAGEMFLHVFLDPTKLNNSILYPTTLNYFYFTNPSVYGVDGKTINWMYALTLPLTAFAGGYAVLRNTLTDENKKSLSLLKLILVIGLLFQWISMYFIHSVYIQYYLPLGWLFAIFTAYLLDDLFFKLKLPKQIKYVIGIMLLVFSLYLTGFSIKANTSRAKMSFTAEKEALENIWKKIPPDSPAYPNVVFRPIIYPVLWGSTFAPYMRNRYPPVYLAIEKNKLPILTGLTDEYFSYLDLESQQYIQKNYQRETLNNSIWKHKD